MWATVTEATPNQSAEETLTEVPEHLLARSKARRAALSGDGDASAETTPATTESTSPEPAKPATAATQPAATPEKAEPEPTPPWVEAAESRKKVPVWVVPVLVALPIFFILYAWTLGEPAAEEGPLAAGGEVYGISCSGCHGGSGGGGSGPALSGGAVVETFARPVDQVTWVALGSTGFRDAGESSYGDTSKPIVGGMPGQAESMDAEDLMAVVLHERAEFGGEAFDADLWEDGFEEAVTAMVPDHAEEYIAVLEEWKASPPV